MLPMGSRISTFSLIVSIVFSSLETGSIAILCTSVTGLDDLHEHAVCSAYSSHIVYPGITLKCILVHNSNIFEVGLEEPQRNYIAN
jgi:hypothetical protein